MNNPANHKSLHHTPTSWRQLNWGSCFLQTLNSQLAPWIYKLYGNHLLKLGELSAEIETSHCPVSHHLLLAQTGRFCQIRANPAKLPLNNKSIDACLLIHTLGLHQKPHQVLREVDRVLIDDGWIIVTSFNPFSLLGLTRLSHSAGLQPFCNSRMFSELRLCDWLTLLNYEILYCRQLQCLPWRAVTSTPLSSNWPPGGCLNIIIARKRTFPLTPEKSRLLIAGRCLQPLVNLRQSSNKV